MDRAEHLAWAKRRALELVDGGELGQAVASIASDLAKHDAWGIDPGFAFLAMDGMGHAAAEDAGAVRRWIEGFG